MTTGKQPIEQSFLRQLLGHHRWVWQAADHEASYRSISDAQRAKLEQVAMLLKPRVEEQLGRTIEPSFCEWVLYVFSRFAPEQQPIDWEGSSSDALLERLWPDIDYAEPFHFLVTYRDASPLLAEAFARFASSIGIEPPDRQDPVGISRLMKAMYSASVAETAAMYRSLSQEDVDELVELVLSLDLPLRRHSFDVPGRMMARVAVTGENRLTKHYARLYAASGSWPGIIYVHVDEAFQRHLAEQYMDDTYNCRESPQIDALLWSCNDQIAEMILGGELSLVDELPYEVLGCGYVLTSDGDVRRLHFGEGYELVPAKGSDAAGPVGGLARAEPNKIFHRYVLDIDLSDPTMAFLELEGERLRIPYVPSYDPVYWKVGLFGECEPYDGEWPEFDVEDFPGEAKEDVGPDVILGLGDKMATPYESAEGINLVHSHIGGLPHWEQEPAYPECPDCGERMKFLARVGDSPAVYALLCADCKIACSVCQMD